jgi:predicted methyltransferase
MGRPKRTIGNVDDPSRQVRRVVISDGPSISPSKRYSTRGLGVQIRDWASSLSDPTQLEAIRMISRSRPSPLRDYDQICMVDEDLLLQVKLLAPYLDGRIVGFIGDNDCTCLAFGILGQLGLLPSPRRMIVLDFDKRILANIRRFASQHGFADKIETHAYNVFDRLPQPLAGSCDWFYVNPPYGSCNEGASVRLFVARGWEASTVSDAKGCIIAPDNGERPWTRTATLQTQRFLSDGGWVVKEKYGDLHSYHLDDDPELRSSTLIVEDVASSSCSKHDWFGRTVGFTEVPQFYGGSVAEPYAHYVREDGSRDYSWN